MRERSNLTEFRRLGQIAWQWLELVGVLFTFVSKLVQKQEDLAAENLFLRRQIALLMEREARPRRRDALGDGATQPAI